MASLTNDSAEQAPLPPVHGTFSLIVWPTPSGVISVNEPPENAQNRSSLGELLRSVAT
jgi:hypothetical protein